MSDEIENNPVPEEDQPESMSGSDDQSDGQPVDAQADAGEDVQADGDADESEATEGDAAALAAAMAAVKQVQGVADSASSETNSDAEPFESPVFENDDSDGAKKGIDLLSDVHMNVRIELGRTKMFVEDVLKLGDGAVVELDKLAGDPVDVFVNNRKVARGEVLVLNDLFCVRISEIVDISATED